MQVYGGLQGSLQTKKKKKMLEDSFEDMGREVGGKV